MKIFRFVPILCAGWWLSFAPPVFARGGMLKEPTLGLPDAFAGRSAVHAVIADRRYHYSGGVFLNGRSALSYTGEAGSLNDFLARLAACPSVRLNVSFTDEPSDAAWTLSHENQKDVGTFRVAVNRRHIAQAAVAVPRA